VSYHAPVTTSELLFNAVVQRKVASRIIAGPRAVAALIAALCAFTASAQEALRSSIAGERAAAERKRALENQSYNLRLGPVSFLLDSSLSFELNDSVNLSTAGNQEDLIVRPQLNTRAYWPLTEKNALYFSVGVGYAKYFNHPVYDRFLVTPGSELSFDLFVKDFRFTFFDRFSYTQNPLDNGAISGVANYGGLDNQAGLNALWDLNKAILSVGYAHANWISSTPQFAYLDRASELFFARAAFLPNPTTAVGIEATGSLTEYDQSFLNNSVGFSAGVFAEWKLTPKLQLKPRVGYVNYQFDTEGPIGRAGNPSTYYFSLDIDHRLNESISHSLEGGREVRLGTFSDFEELYFVRHGITWNLIKDVHLSTQWFYEHGTYPPFVFFVATNQPVFLFGETFDRFGAGLSLSYRLMEKLYISLAYRFTLKDSDQRVRDYQQNALTLGLTYRF